jgi:hypothetical protein
MKSGMESVHPAKLLKILAPQVRFELTTLRLTANTIHLSAVISNTVKHSKIRRFSFTEIPELSAIILKYQLSASVSASVNTASPREELL